MAAHQIYVEREAVAPLVDATFPEYRGRKYQVRVASTVTLSDLNWHGGTRSRYRGATLAGQSTGGADRFNAMAPWDPGQVEGKAIEIPPGACVVEHSMFCGKDHGITIHLNPADAPKYIEGPKVELTENEEIVLEATGSLKSSYNGKDRYQMRRDEGRSGRAFMSRSEWDAAKATLIVKGLLNKAGAITNAGRNARRR